MGPNTYIQHTRVTTTNINENKKAETREKRNKKRRRLVVVLDMLYEMILVASVCLCCIVQWRQYDKRTTDTLTTYITTRTVCPSSTSFHCHHLWPSHSSSSPNMSVRISFFLVFSFSQANNIVTWRIIMTKEISRRSF
jgi:hypothetical protein